MLPLETMPAALQGKMWSCWGSIIEGYTANLGCQIQNFYVKWSIMACCRVSYDIGSILSKNKAALVFTKKNVKCYKILCCWVSQSWAAIWGKNVWNFTSIEVFDVNFGCNIEFIRVQYSDIVVLPKFTQPSQQLKENPLWDKVH